MLNFLGCAPTGEVLAGAKIRNTTKDPTEVRVPATEVKPPATTAETNDTAIPAEEDLPGEVPVTPVEVMVPMPDAPAEAEDPAEVEDAEDKIPYATPAKSVDVNVSTIFKKDENPLTTIEVPTAAEE